MLDMLAEESRRRQNILKELVLEMANCSFEDDEIRKTAIRLKELYTSNFRHNYSEFFPLILEIAKDDNTYNLDYLAENLEVLRAYVENDYVSGGKEFTGLYLPLTKLSDHLNLEIGRYNYYSINEQKIRDLEKRNETMQSELRNSTQELIDAKKHVSSMQTELIAVLSIFAAIVLTFSGSLSFIGNALSGMNDTPVFKSVLFILLCGLIVFNAVFVMMYIVAKITGRSIYAHCKSENCTCGKNGQPKCSGLTRVRKRMPYIFWLNAVLLIFLIVDIVLWYTFRCNGLW